MLIHISGASGSGKTTILNTIVSWCRDEKINAGGLDADDVVAQIMTQIDTMSDASDSDRGKAFEHLLTTRITRLVASKKIYIIAGLIDTMFAGIIYYARIQPDYTFYIKISDGKLLSQYLNRIIVLLGDKHYKDQLLHGTTSIVFDKDSLLTWANDTHSLYCDTLNYTYLPGAAITTAIKSHIRKYHNRKQSHNDDDM